MTLGAMKRYPACNSEELLSAQKLSSSVEGKYELPSPAIKVIVDHKHVPPMLIHVPSQEVHRIYNIFERHEYSLPASYKTPPIMTVVDIGANIGCFSLYANMWAKKVFLYCFEPNPQIFGLLQKNTSTLENAYLSQCALSDKKGCIDLYLHPKNTGRTSLTPVNRKGKIKVSCYSERSGDALKNAGVNNIDVLKVDTEGAEVPILLGLKSYLPNISVIMLEYHSLDDREKIMSILNGFQLYSEKKHNKNNEVGTIKLLNSMHCDVPNRI